MKNLIRVVSALAGLAAAFALTASAAAGNPPHNTSPPTIEGAPIVGKTLGAGTGGWLNTPTSYTFQWLRCDAKGNNCASIQGETSQKYTVLTTDAGHTLVVLVTATNSSGSVGPVNSKPSEVVSTATAPASTAAPTITGKAEVGASLVADPGKYSGARAKISFQWLRCAAGGSDCLTVSGAAGQIYDLTNTDLGHALRVQVKATNEFGTTTTESKATTAVKAAAAQTPAVTTTMVASREITTCCQAVRLSGAVSSQKAGEPITILARGFDDVVPARVAYTTSNGNGTWSAVVRPEIRTTYTAQTATSTSHGLTVSVHPRVGFGISGNNFSAKVTARDSFGGRIAYFQVRKASGSWHTMAPVVIDQRSVAKFRVPLPRGKTYTVRIYLPASQAGPGYLDGESHVRRVGGNA